MPDPDRIELRGLRVDAIVGVLPHERTTPQPLEIDLDIETDLAPAGESDDLRDTVDYGAIVAIVEDVTMASQPLLLERLAELLASAVLEHEPRVAAVTIAVRKLEPPVPQRLESSGVRIRRASR